MRRALLWSFITDALAQVIFLALGVDETLRIWAGGILAGGVFSLVGAERSLALLYPISLGIFLQVIVAGAVHPIVAVFAGSGAFVATILAYPRELFTSERGLKQGALFLVGYSLAARAFLASSLNLLEQEAYYWKYAENLSLGYLDHPPLVAWSIALGTALFGDTEWGVRCMALVWWGLAAVYVWRLAALLYDRRAAWGALGLFSVLPYFAGAGFIMSPEAPLLFFWAAALYYSVNLLLTGDSRWWVGITFTIGGGLLAKYPMALFGTALGVSLLLVKSARRWVFRWEPYAAAVGMLALFSPVLLWNSGHDWASFRFQGPERMESTQQFSFHLLVLHVLAVLTPVGIRDFAVWMRETWLRRLAPDRDKIVLAPFLLAPLAVFIFFSFSHEVKINWTGPVFLAILPFLGFRLSKECREGRRAWLMSIAVLLVAVGMSMSYFTTGIPGIPYSEKLQRFVGSRILARELSRIEDNLRRERGADVVVVGMDKHYTGSHIGFYRANLAYERGEAKPKPTVGRHLFGGNSLSFRFWSSPADFRGRTLLLVSRYEWDLNDAIVGRYAHREKPPTALIAMRGSSRVGRLYYRVVYDYQPEKPAKDS
jgi:dolichol-phosphate mannosyltransferase